MIMEVHGRNEETKKYWEKTSLKKSLKQVKQSRKCNSRLKTLKTCKFAIVLLPLPITSSELHHLKQPHHHDHNINPNAMGNGKSKNGFNGWITNKIHRTGTQVLWTLAQYVKRQSQSDSVRLCQTQTLTLTPQAMLGLEGKTMCHTHTVTITMSHSHSTKQCRTVELPSNHLKFLKLKNQRSWQTLWTLDSDTENENWFDSMDPNCNYIAHLAPINTRDPSRSRNWDSSRD